MLSKKQDVSICVAGVESSCARQRLEKSKNFLLGQAPKNYLSYFGSKKVLKYYFFLLSIGCEQLIMVTSTTKQHLLHLRVIKLKRHLVVAKRSWYPNGGEKSGNYEISNKNVVDGFQRFY